MKNNFISLLVVLLSVCVISGCLTTTNKSNNSNNAAKKEVIKVPALYEMVTEIYDVNNGNRIGVCSILESETGLNIDLTIGATQAITSYDGTFDLAEYTGNFSSLVKDEKTGMYLIKSEKSSDDLYVVIHEYNNMYKFVFDEIRPDHKNLYLVTVFPPRIYDFAFDETQERYMPSFSIHAFKPYIISQGVIVLESSTEE